MESVIELLALVLTALALVPAAAHVIEMPNKMPLPRDAYLTVQRVYRGWSYAGIVVIAAIIATLWLAVISTGRAEVPAAIAFSCILMTQAVFWGFTFPVNRRTHNWTEVPEDWELLRDRWEFSHAASAFLIFTALVCVTLAVLAG